MYRITIEEITSEHGFTAQHGTRVKILSQHIFAEMKLMEEPGMLTLMACTPAMQPDFKDTQETIGERAAGLIERLGLSQGQPVDDTKTMAAIIDGVITDKVVADVLSGKAHKPMTKPAGPVELAAKVAEVHKPGDPTKEEMVAFLLHDPATHGRTTVEKFAVSNAVETAIYWYANLHHSGQASNLYSVLSTSPYKPGVRMAYQDVEDDPQVAKFYKMLCEAYD